VIASYYTLHHLAIDLHGRLAGLRLQEAFSQNRNELVLVFSADNEDGDSQPAVVISCEPSSNAIVVRDQYARARRNSVDLFPDLAGTSLDAISISPNDREILFRFSNRLSLLAQFFGSRANVLLCDEHRIVRESFLKHIPAGTVVPETLPFREPGDTAVFRALLLRGGDRADEPLSSALKRIAPRFGPLLVREIATRAGFDAAGPVDEFSDRDVESLFSVWTAIRSQLLAPPVPRVYYDGRTPVEFSIIPLLHLAEFREELFDDIHAAIRHFIGSAHMQRDFHDARKALLLSMQKELGQVERTLSKIGLESVDAADAERLERLGRLLTAHLHTLSKGMTEAIVEDVLGPTPEPVIVPMDPHLSPAKNAERYYDRAKKVRHTAEEQAERREELDGRSIRLAQLIEDLELVTSPEELRTFGLEHAALLSEFGIRIPGPHAAKKPTPPPFRIFTVAGGFQVWAGKSGENNDLLSTRHTAKNDLWFHARGVGGSHVVLKIGTGKGEVSRMAIEQAAAIAGYYSKMKKSGLVSVTMCEGKYVRKPKGAPAGTVTVEREETILIRPALPFQE
jgi:predicted ribosome quality control (RQC) complex YloA/Tae2 family protein